MLTRAALERAGSRIAEIAPRLSFVTLEDSGEYRHDDRPIPPSEVDTDIAWATADLLGQQPRFRPFLTTLHAAPSARWCQLPIAGLDNPMLGRLIARGIRLTKASGQAVPIAEHVLAHAFSLILPLAEQAEAQTRQEWRRTPFREIGQTSWTLVGFGAIGGEIARRLRPFGAHLTVVRRDQAPLDLADAVIALDGLPDVLPRTDVVVLACPLNAATRDLADERFFARLKPGAILINIARGGLVVEGALRDGLARQQPAHAVLDVFAAEPLPPDNWMWSHPKVRVTAHTSNAGQGTPARQDALFLDNLARFLRGETLRGEAAADETE